MFSQVCLSTGGGVESGGITSMHCRSPVPHPGGKLRGLAWQALHDTILRGTVRDLVPGRRLQAHFPCNRGLQVHTLKGISRPTRQWGVSRPTPGGHPGTHLGGIPACTVFRPPPADSYWCGRYAFLLAFAFLF